MTHTKALEEKVFSSFHQLEEHFLEDAIAAKKWASEKFPDSENIMKSSPEESAKSLIDVLLVLAYQDIKASEKIMPKICEVYKKETEEILRVERVRTL